MIGRMLNALVRRAADGDWEALEALREIETLAPAAMTAGLAVSHRKAPPGATIDTARAALGFSYAQLAQSIGVTRSAVQQRVNTTHHKGTPGCGHALCVGMRRCRTANRKATA